MKLYYMPGACPLAPHIVMQWMGMEYELERMSREALKQPPYLALNPTGSVPTLVDGDFILTQNAAVLEYLSELHPEAGLMPDTLEARADVRRWLGFLNSDLHRTFGNIFAVQGLSSNPDCQAEITANTEQRLRSLFKIADDQLANEDWLVGTRSIADPYLYTILRWARLKNIALDDMANLTAFFDRMQADPGVKKALEEQGLSV